jgi:ParB-like chromosome segregation protein Spo0J
MNGLNKGDDIPPILVRKWKNGYQVLDGHHRFYAYKQLKKKTIPAKIVPDKDIETVGKAAN